MTTARTIVKRAMQVAGILVKGEAPSADEADDGLTALNMMLSGWSNDSGLVYARAWLSFSLTGGTGQYSIGTGQTFNTTRPVSVISAYLRSGTTDCPVTVINDVDYNNIEIKSILGLPEVLNYDNSYPTGQIRLFPVPSIGYTLFLLLEKELTQFALDDNVSYPPGWEEAMVYNLAMRFYPEYQQQTDPRVEKLAASTKQNIMLSIARLRGIDAPNNASSANTVFAGYGR